MAEEKISIFNKRNTILDNLYGLPGVNEILRHKLLDYISRMAKSKTYFSNTTYSIIYNLIQSKKIGLFFIPYLRTSKFLVSNVPIQVVGGYDFNLKRIEIMVKWSFGVDMISQMFEAHIPLICNKVFALILSEALMIYNYKHNGSLVINSEFVKKWYRIYFEGVFGDTLHRTELAKNLATIVSNNYASRIYESIEKAIIENRSPSIVISKKGENTELDIEGIPSIKKGDKELEDIFGDSIEDYVNEKREEYNIDNEGYKELKEFIGEFANLGFFLYKNRELYLNPQNLEAMPETAFETLNKGKLSAEAAQATLHRLEEEHQQKEEAEYQKYLDNNPKIKAALEKTKNEEWDKRTEKYFGELTTKYNSEGRAIVGKYAKPPSLQEYINNDSKNNFIQAFMLDSGVATEQDIQDAIDGTKNCINEYERALARYAKINSNPNIDEKTRNNALNILKATEKQAQDVYASFKELFKNRLVDKSLLDKFPKSFKDINLKGEAIKYTPNGTRQIVLPNGSIVTYEAVKDERNFSNIFGFAQGLLDDTKKKNRQIAAEGIISNNNSGYNNSDQIKVQQAKLQSLTNNLKEQYELFTNSTNKNAAKDEISSLVRSIQDVIKSSQVNSLITTSSVDKEIQDGLRNQEYLNYLKTKNKILQNKDNIINNGSALIRSNLLEQNRALERNSILEERSPIKIENIAQKLNTSFEDLIADKIIAVKQISFYINQKDKNFHNYIIDKDDIKSALKYINNNPFSKNLIDNKNNIKDKITQKINDEISRIRQNNRNITDDKIIQLAREIFLTSTDFRKFCENYEKIIYGKHGVREFERSVFENNGIDARGFDINHLRNAFKDDLSIVTNDNLKELLTKINSNGGIKAYADRRKNRKTTAADLAIIQTIDPNKELTKAQYEALMKFPELFSSLAKYSINPKNVPALLVDKKSFNSAQKGY